ncbi:MAG TPA: PD-(D/E)XK nuclease family protein, partial [Planctomycetota bacterium]|nr:PD-(D/E)XK nuclease family protein [Planctomycetota bacterium]
LQIPVYMMALQQSGKFTAAGGAYYCLKDNPDDFGKVSYFGDEKLLKQYCGLGVKKSAGLFADDELASILAGCRDQIVRYAACISEGVFNPSTLAPTDAGCGYCIARGMCRRNESKAARMAKEAANG